MVPILYHDPVNAASRAVLLVAKELNVDVTYRSLAEYQDQELAAASQVILSHDSKVITSPHKAIIYLCEIIQDGHSAYPKNETTRKRIEDILEMDEKSLQPPLKNVLDSVLVLNEKEIPIDKIRNLQNSYNELEKIFETSQYVADVFTIADLCCLATISTATIFTPISSAKYPKLFQWYAKCKQLPYYKEANSAGLAKLDMLVEENMGCANRT